MRVFLAYVVDSFGTVLSEHPTIGRARRFSESWNAQTEPTETGFRNLSSFYWEDELPNGCFTNMPPTQEEEEEECIANM